MRKLALSDDILLSVDKPARYIGGELNSRDKRLEDVDIRFVMCFPDVYEIGMSHIGMQIICSITENTHSVRDCSHHGLTLIMYLEKKISRFFL